MHALLGNKSVCICNRWVLTGVLLIESTGQCVCTYSKLLVIKKKYYCISYEAKFTQMRTSNILQQSLFKISMKGDITKI